MKNPSRSENTKRDAKCLLSQENDTKKKCSFALSENAPAKYEVLASGIPAFVTENELQHIFKNVGKVHDLRYVQNGGDYSYIVVEYCSEYDADSAVEMLNNLEIRSNHHISVSRIIQNNRIFLGNIPKSFTEDDIHEKISGVTRGVSKIILYPSLNDRKRNRGYGFVEYTGHTEASAAREKLISEPLVWKGQEIKVDWAQPELEVDDEIMNKVKVLYVRNLALSTTEQQLLDLFCSLDGQVDRVRKMKDYAFIHFAAREQAEKAKEHFHGKLLDGCEMDISWSKPVTNREEYQRRKAMSKVMLSKAVTPSATTSVLTALNVHGEPIILNPRVRNAAGAQGFTSSKPFVCSPPKQPEISLQSFSPPNAFIPTPAFAPVNGLKSPIEQYNVSPAGIPILYTAALDRPSSSEDIYNHTIEYPAITMGTPASPYTVPSSQWAPPQYLVPQPVPFNVAGVSFVSTGPTSAPPPGQPAAVSYIPYTGMMNNNYYGGQLPCSQFFQNSIMTQVTNINGSNMNFEDRRKNL